MNAKPPAQLPATKRTQRVTPRQFHRQLKRFSPGLLDAGCASAAGFISSLYAVRVLEPDVLGAYALYFSGVCVMGRLLEQLFFLPSRLSGLSERRDLRVSILSWSIPAGLILACLGGSIVLFAGLPIRTQVPFEASAKLAVTAALLAAFSPLQDHLRQTLHLSGRSWSATIVSATQLLIAANTVLLFHLQGAPSEWVPFGSLAIANCISLLLGLTLVSRAIKTSRTPRPSLRGILRQGRTYVLAESMLSLSGFGAPLLVASLASTQALGIAEASRVVSQPLFVLGLGASAIVGPRLMEAGANRSRGSATRALRAYTTAIVLSGVAYLIAVGWSYAWNPMQALIPAAYALPGLAALQIIRATSHTVSGAPTSVLYGARRNRGIVMLRALSATITITATAILAAWLHSYTLPLVQLLAATATGLFGLHHARLATRPPVKASFPNQAFYP